MGEWANEFLLNGYALWAKLIEFAKSVLGQDIDSPNSMFFNGWIKIEGLNQSIFVPVATALIVLFFVIGFCRETTDVHSEVRLETVIKYLLQLSITEGLVVYNIQVSKAILETFSRLFAAVNGYTGSIPQFAPSNIDDITEYISDLGVMSSIGYFVVNLLFFLLMVICGCVIVYTVITRVFKIMLIIPFGALAFSTIAGGRVMSQSASSFVKYIISLGAEMVLIGLAFVLMQFITSDTLGLGRVLGGNSMGFATILGTELESMMLAFLVVGMVKSGQQLIQKALAL